MLLPTPRHCERSDLSAEALAKAEAIQNLSTAAVWIASSQELLAMTAERTIANCAYHSASVASTNPRGSSQNSRITR